VATAEAIEAELPEARVTIRWPNDLMLDEGKVGGILAESVSDRLVLGIGVNLSTPSDGFPELRTPPATLRERAKGSAAPTRSGLARSVISHLRSRLDGTHPARDAIEALAQQDALLGRWVDTEQEGVGVARGIDAEGRLVLERRDGTRVRISAGRVTPTSPDGTGGAEHVDGSNSSFGR
jgi:BirA family biotin operon repressor/biotin-[acetyl-CoA-carboxylase] ligase